MSLALSRSGTRNNGLADRPFDRKGTLPLWENAFPDEIQSKNSLKSFESRSPSHVRPLNRAGQLMKEKLWSEGSQMLSFTVYILSVYHWINVVDVSEKSRTLHTAVVFGLFLFGIGEVIAGLSPSERFSLPSIWLCLSWKTFSWIVHSRLRSLRVTILHEF